MCKIKKAACSTLENYIYIYQCVKPKSNKSKCVYWFCFLCFDFYMGWEGARHAKVVVDCGSNGGGDGKAVICGFHPLLTYAGRQKLINTTHSGSRREFNFANFRAINHPRKTCDGGRRDGGKKNTFEESSLRIPRPIYYIYIYTHRFLTVSLTVSLSSSYITV